MPEKFESSVGPLPNQSPDLHRTQEVLLDPALSIEARQALTTKLKFLDENLLFAWHKGKRSLNSVSENEGDRGNGMTETLRLLRLESIRHPELIRNGLTYPETRSYALSTANTAIDLFKKLYPGQHYSERDISKDQSLMVTIFDAFSDAREAVDAELADEKSSERDMLLSVLSEMLDSPVPNHRAYAEKTLLRELPLLMQRLSDEWDDKSPETHIAKAWQNMLLRSSDPKRFPQVFGALKNVWDAMPAHQKWNTLYQKILSQGLALRSKPLEENKDFLAIYALDLAGLDGKTVIGEWGLASRKSEERRYGPSHQYAYESNMRALYALKEVAPEAPAALHADFGITHFGCYTTETLKKQYQERESQDPYGVVIFPYADHNGAFMAYAQEIAKMQNELSAHGYRLRIIEAEGKIGIGKTLLRLDSQYASGSGGNKIDFGIIGGHGTISSILFGEGRSPNQQIHMADLSGDGITRAAAQIFEKDARIILISCGTGMDGGIAQAMKERFGWTVIAPPEPVAARNIQVSFETGRPMFDIEYFDPEKNETVAKRQYSRLVANTTASPMDK